MKKRRKKPRGGATYLCPRCRKPSAVYKTRRDDDGVVHRHRFCECGVEFHTEERRAKS